MQGYYNDMIDKDISPSYITQAILIMGFLLNQDYASAELADKILAETIANSSEVDFFSSFDPATAVPSYLFTPHMEIYNKLSETNRSLEAFNKFFEVNKARIPAEYKSLDIKFLCVACATYAQDKKWQEIDRLWNVIIDSLRTEYLPYNQNSSQEKSLRNLRIRYRKHSIIR